MKDVRESHTVFSHEDFTEAFKVDLQRAKARVLVQSPFLTIRRINELAKPIENCARRFVRVCVFAKRPADSALESEDDERYRRSTEYLLSSLGVHVTFRPDLHEKLAVIDDCVFWEGSLNILSYRNTKERMTRWESLGKVEEAVRSHHLDRCEICCNGKSDLASIIVARRKLLGISQRELCSRARVSKAILSNLETGKRDFKLSTLSRLFAALHLGYRVAPLHVLPAIDDLIDNSLGRTK